MLRRSLESSPFDAPARGQKGPRVLELFDELARSRFAALPGGLSREDLLALDGYLIARLELEREERRMHFGALALVSLLFFVLLPAVVSGGFANLALDLLALLLLALLLPYVFVYSAWENRVRAMGSAHLRLLEEMARRKEIS